MTGMHQPRHSDDCGHEEDSGEEGQRMRHVERRVMVMRGAIVTRTVLDVVRWVSERPLRASGGGLPIVSNPKPIRSVWVEITMFIKSKQMFVLRDIIKGQ